MSELGLLSVKEEYLNSAKEYAKTQNGICLSEYYINSDNPLLWKCHVLEHDPWNAMHMSVVRNGSWCPECRGRTPKNRMFRKVHEYAQKQNGICLSEEYVNVREPLEWKCDNEEHPSWFKSYSDVVQKNRWCRRCK